MPPSKDNVDHRLQRLDQMRKPLVTRSIALLVGFCLFLVGLHAWSLWTARSHQLEQTAVNTANMARALASQAESSIKLGDAALVELVERYQHDGLEGAAGERLHARLRQIVAHTPELQEAFVYGADGDRLATSLPHLVNGNNADREYFIYHKTHTDLGLRVGQPIRSRSSGVLAIPLSRRINRPDGSFGGVAMASLRLQFFGRFYDRFDVGPTGTIILALDDGTLLYRRPFKASMVGTDIANGPVFQLYKRNGPVGTAMLTSKIDRIERLYSYRHLEGFPLLVASAQTKDEILAGWWTTVIKTTLVVMFAVGVLAWGGRRMIVQIRVREALDGELRNARASLELHNISLRALADSDGLTGLGNRRLFEEALEREVGRARRSGLPFALILTDVDFFKKYNDRYGHVAGDACLRQVALAIASGARRPADLAARYGGEEFALILPDTDLDGAMAVAELIREAVAELQLEHADSPNGRVTLSLGVVAGYPAREAEQPSCAWVEAADTALYDAKAAGRNRAVGRSGTERVAA
ncbi:sensor domain-containing diguanylate cyclase [Herbaspirillum sp. SJZ107]|uniref:GGDEF domain-containing protein n=1 Tax=Herbaspirillum sp. SJZ107 TaxID=2572881 RepID=UPI0011514346|nr:sensor domain-containing diguanylate cyclase [Herbaspirillum sp. SJZ107]TQK10306.1 diguanylate cyclase (GGDEF)-like protein [Herbaspirillum sp. SJZ107]